MSSNNVITSVISSNSAIARITSSNNATTSNASTRCRLLSLPAELRNRIWKMVVNGDSPVIHMDRRSRKACVDLASRRSIIRTCRQIQQEADLMFFASNTFLFKANDRRINYGALDNVANWLHSITGKQRNFVGRIIICTKKQAGMVNWSWICAGYCGMDFGFGIGERIDKEVWAEGDDEEFALEGFESWGCKDGHKCKKSHFLLSR